MCGPRLARLTVYPVKSLDGKTVESANFAPAGGLLGDRQYALHDSDGDFVNGKAEPTIHRIRSGFDLDSHTLCLRRIDALPGTAASYTLPEERALTEDWVSQFLGYDVTIERNDEVGFPDDTVRPGPTVISTATIETIASWYDDISPDEMRRRLRPNVEIEGVPAFWEDRLFADYGEVVRFTLGDVVLEGVNPCQRCVVPTRNPDTGEETPGFRERFIEQRRATKPEWTSSDRFDHDYRVMVNTRVPGTESVTADPIGVGDPVEIIDVRPE